MDLPLIARADLGECGALRGGAEAGELQRVACRRAIANEVTTVSPWASPAWNTKKSLPALPVSTSAPAPPSRRLPALVPKSAFTEPLP